MKTIISFLVLISFSTSFFGQAREARFQRIIDSTYQANSESNGIMVHVESPNNGVSWSGAAGYADKSNQESIEPDQPALIASCTKTYVSASILRLVEEKKVCIDQPIKDLISKKTRLLFESDGYVLDSITIAHLLSHTSGIEDYVGQDFMDFLFSDPMHRWTRDEQLEFAIRVGDPLAKPGKKYKYADTNYLLLTEVIEKLTGRTFYESMRVLLRYESLDINNTWFHTLEDEPGGVKELVHQYWGDLNSFQVDASSDLYGGGGIACTTRDLAIFSYGLFNSEIIKDTAVFNLIYTKIHTSDSIQSNYCLGLMVEQYGALNAYGHLGFWGTCFFYIPELKTSIAVYILEKEKRKLYRDIIDQIIQIIES